MVNPPMIGSTSFKVRAGGEHADDEADDRGGEEDEPGIAQRAAGRQLGLRSRRGPLGLGLRRPSMRRDGGHRTPSPMMAIPRPLLRTTSRSSGTRSPPSEAAISAAGSCAPTRTTPRFPAADVRRGPSTHRRANTQPQGGCDHTRCAFVHVPTLFPRPHRPERRATRCHPAVARGRARSMRAPRYGRPSSRPSGGRLAVHLAERVVQDTRCARRPGPRCRSTTRSGSRTGSSGRLSLPRISCHCSSGHRDREVVQPAQHLGVRAGVHTGQVEEGQAVAVADVEEEVRRPGEVAVLEQDRSPGSRRRFWYHSTVRSTSRQISDDVMDTAAGGRRPVLPGEQVLGPIRSRTVVYACRCSSVMSDALSLRV